MLLESKVTCIECYTTTWRESKYTLIHMDQANKIRGSALKRTMTEMKDTHGIIGSVIHGYETLSSNAKKDSQVTDHPGFKRIVQILNENIEELRIWMKTGDVMTNKSGILWGYMESRDPKSMTHSQLVERVVKLTKIAKEHDSLKPTHEALLTAFTAQQNELIKEKAQSNDFFRQLISKIEECGNLKIQLATLGKSTH